MNSDKHVFRASEYPASLEQHAQRIEIRTMKTYSCPKCRRVLTSRHTCKAVKA